MVVDSPMELIPISRMARAHLEQFILYKFFEPGTHLMKNISSPAPQTLNNRNRSKNKHQKQNTNVYMQQCCYAMFLFMWVGTWHLAIATVHGKRQSVFQDQPSLQRGSYTTPRYLWHQRQDSLAPTHFFPPKAGRQYKALARWLLKSLA